jgi:DNA integrity scanning protein DisA with diadenylate cyclase activity
MFESIFARAPGSKTDALGPTIELAIEIGREGREGRRVGALFTVGDEKSVLEHSRPLILDPLAGHPDHSKRIKDRDLRGTVKELAKLDGAFVVSDDGIVLSACRYLDASVSDVVLPLGLGGRHMVAAGITRLTRATAVVVSESAMVRVFHGGALIAEVVPDFWYLSHLKERSSHHLPAERVSDSCVLITEDD